jgi:hypothetical protein
MSKQAALFFARRSRESRQDPSAACSRTHDFSEGFAAADSSDVFPDATEPIVFAFTVARTSGSAAGTILSFGTTAQTAVEMDGDEITISVGDGSLALVAPLPVANVEYRVTIFINPGDGHGIVWVNGEVVDESTDPFGTVWCDSGPGEVGSGLTDSELIGKVSGFAGQRPWTATA